MMQSQDTQSRTSCLQKEDDDNDSMDDTWEIANGLDPLDDGSVNIDNGPNGDIDSDGIYNLQEYLASIP
jgi:hypothetical protein